MMFKRLIAYVLDLSVISLSVSYISSLFIDNDKIISLDNNLSSLSESFLVEEIGFLEYINSSFRTFYEIDSLRLIFIVMALSFSIIYFIFIPYFMKGQTIFKSILNLRIVSANKLNLFSIFKREFFKSGILYYLLLIMSIIIFKEYYMYVIVLFVFIHISIAIYTIKQILLKKELWYEKLSKTKVIEVKDETLYRTRTS